jgi:iron complex outermembrane receptor protein
MCNYIPFSALSLFITAISFSQETKNYNVLYAVNDTVKNKKEEILQEVIITANQQNKTVNIGKSRINPMDLPQATALIGQAIIQNQQIVTVTDLLKNVNGVYIMGTTGGYQEEIASRGSALSSSNTFKNGIRYFSGMKTEFSGIEKAEFLKGSAAILFGNVAPGGILNLVTKKPKFESGGEIGFTVGSFNTAKPILDIYGNLNKSKTIAYRINGSYTQAKSFRRNVNSDSYYINPSFLAKLSKKTQLLIEGDFLKSTATPDFGAGIVNYELVDIPRNRFLGVSWGYYDAKQSYVTATLTHKLNDNWELNYINGLRYYETDLFTNARPNASGGTISATGNWTRSIQRSEVKDNYFIQQLDLKGKFATGKIKHQFLFGVDSEIYKTKTTVYKNFTNYDTINIFQEYNASHETTIPNLDLNTLTTAPVNRFGIYTQDLISFTNYFKLLAGVRYSYQDTKSDILSYSTNATATTRNYDQAFSPRIGLIFQPSVNNSLFASYSNSFQVNTGTDINGAALKPSIIDQYEIGIKNKLFEERLFANLTAYQISNSNLAQTSLENGNTNSNIKELAGATRTQGIELDLIANPVKDLSIIAGYSFSETIYTKSNTYIEGSQLKYNPKNTANLSFNYKFEKGKLKGLNFGLINTYFGTRFAGRSTRITIVNDSYKLIALSDCFQVDATMAYVHKKWALRTKLSNIFNELNYNIHDDNSLNPIAPRNYSVSLNYTF